MRRRTNSPRGAALAHAVAAALVVLAFSGTARAELAPLSGTVHGGDVTVGDRGSLTLAAGWPSAYVRYDIATRSSFGIGFQGEFFYGMPVFGFALGLGTGFSMPMRLQVMDRDRWSVAIFIKPGFNLGFSDAWWGYHPHDCYHFWSNAFFLDFEIEPGVRVGLLARRFLSVFFGASVPLHFLVVVPNAGEAELDVFVPITLTGGIELALTAAINVFVQVQIGPAFGSYVRCVACEPDGGCESWGRAFAAAFTGRFHGGFTFHF